MQGPGHAKNEQRQRLYRQGRHGAAGSEKVQLIESAGASGRAPGLPNHPVDHFPYLGHGVGLRPPHYGRMMEGSARADWFEVISENFMIRGGRPLLVLERAREQAPIVLHGVSLNLGGSDPLRSSYLDELAGLIARFEPAWVSDHLCWGSIGGHYAHDLLPLPYTEEALELTAARIREVQDRLGRQ